MKNVKLISVAVLTLIFSSCEFDSYTIKGIVKDKYSKSPISNLRIGIYGYKSEAIFDSEKIFNEYATTDKNGNYSIEIDDYYKAEFILITANYTIEYEDKRYESYYNNDLDTKSAKDLDIKLSPKMIMYFKVKNLVVEFDSVQIELYYQKHSIIPNSVDSITKYFNVLEGENDLMYKIFKSGKILMDKKMRINILDSELIKNSYVYTIDLKE